MICSYQLPVRYGDAENHTAPLHLARQLRSPGLRQGLQTLRNTKGTARSGTFHHPQILAEALSALLESLREGATLLWVTDSDFAKPDSELVRIPGGEMAQGWDLLADPGLHHFLFRWSFLFWAQIWAPLLLDGP